MPRLAALALWAAAQTAMTLGAAPAGAQGGPTLKDTLDQALTLTPDMENGRALFRKCVRCHGEDGWGSLNGAYPQIAGQHRGVIVKQIVDIRFGVRDNPAMLPVVTRDALGGPQALADVAAYVSSLPMSPTPGLGPGTDLARGGALFERTCGVCHLNDGEGDDEDLFPKLVGQNYPYLVRQLKRIKEGKRGNAQHGMINRLKRMSAAELEAVADYVSRLYLPPLPSRDVRVQELPPPD